MARRLLLVAVLPALIDASLHAASFVVPRDRDLIHGADAIVVASAVHSYTRVNAAGAIETVTTLSVEESIKGDINTDTIDVVEPGGIGDDGRGAAIPGVPRFRDGNRYVLMLVRTEGEWHVLDIALGNFAFATARDGTELLMRDSSEIVGWNPHGSPHRERARLAAAFLAFSRIEAAGGLAKVDYFVDAESLDLLAPPSNSHLGKAVPLVAPYTATSYTFTISGSLGGRWNVFPSAVNIYTVGSEPGAPGSSTTAVTTGISSWDNDPSSNVNYVYAGADTSGAHTSGLHSPDGENTVSFEQDLSAWGITPFTCSSNGYSGTLGIGGITSAIGTHTGPNGETFATTQEGDVMMNKGLANCTLLFNNGDFNSAVTHELGHTLGFRHSDQTRADNPSTPCSSDPTLECSTSAIMKAFITTGLNGALQTWDQHAVQAVYPGSSVTAPAIPTGVHAHATTSKQVVVTWNAVVGATSYAIFRRDPGVALRQISTSTTNSYTDNSVAASTAYLYAVAAVNAGGSSPTSALDLATTVIFTDDPLVAGVTIIKAVHLAQLRTAVNAVRALDGLSAATFTDSATPGVVVKAVHITQLRSDLDAATSGLGLPSGGWTNAITTGSIIRAVDFQEIRNRVK